MPRIPPELCTRCKGYKRLCGLPRCPILERFRSQITAINMLRDRSLTGYTPPSTIVGEHGYPRVSIHYMIPPDTSMMEARLHDDPQAWASSNTPLSKIIELRSRLVSAILRMDVRDPWRLYELEIPLAASSVKPVDSEAVLSNIPKPRLVFDGVSKPVGPSAPAIRVRVTSNPKPPKIVEKLIWDDMTASRMIIKLYESGVDYYTIQRLLSLGMLGRLRNRRIVPTRWAITAVDDTVSQQLRRRIVGYREVDRVEVYKWEYLGNKFIIVMKPGPGSIEWLEAWHPSGLWTSGTSRITYWRLIEDPKGRATASDGGFSAARTSILEYMESKRVKGDAVIIREIKPSYYAPVGNWHIRESVRRALERGPILINPDVREFRGFLEKETSIPIGELARRTILLGIGRRITRITDFM